LPGVTRWLLAFQACNSCNFTIALGAPLVLTARHLGANEFHIGIMSALPIMLTALQLFATNLVDRLGYRRLMLMGWSARSFMLLLISPLPFLVGKAPSEYLVWGMILPIMGFSAIRGFASGAWLPWLSAVLPPSQRGNYLGREQRTMNLGTFATLLLSGWFLGTNPSNWQYALLFVFAWMAGMASVYFLRKTDDTPPTARQGEPRRGIAELLRGVRRTWRHTPFRRTMHFIFVYTLALSAFPAFLVLFVKEELHFKEGEVLVVQAANAVGVFITAVYWGMLSDRSGSRPLLRIADIGMIIIVLYWIAAAFNFHTTTFLEAAVAYVLWGACAAAHAVAQVRLVLGCYPKRELLVGTAVFQVIASVSGGIAPLLTGWILMKLRSGDAMTPGAGRSAFVVVFALSLALALLSQILLSRVPEMKAIRTHKLLMQVIYDWPIKVLSGMNSNTRK
ncbi:MFS transporter, partial [Candidatus Sumerlaeota bacterium]|nr:MFS transporter [Candidatus Sumerlaeota bacterium]